MGAFSLFHWLVVMAVLALFLVPFAKILQRAGRSGWWVILWLVPLVNIAGLWLFAFGRWPALDRQQHSS